jgi:anti-sigma B factor antagonist
MRAELLGIQRVRPRSYRLVGELDVSNADNLAEELREDCRAAGDVVLDISGLTFMDSSGLHAVLDACERLGSNGHLILKNPTSAVQRILEVSNIQQMDGIRVEKTEIGPTG